MSIDVWFTPLDVSVLHDRIFPYLRGEVDQIDDLFAEARRMESQGSLVYEVRAPVFDKVRKREGATFPDWYDEEMLVWFRPYFVVQNQPTEEVVRLVDNYRTAGPKEIVDIVREQIRLLAPDLADQVKLPSKLPARGLRDKAEELAVHRAAYAALKAGKDYRHPEAPRLNAADLLSGDIYRSPLALHESLQPTWENRAWFFEALFGSHGLPEWMDLLERVQTLFEPLFAGLPQKARAKI